MGGSTPHFRDWSGSLKTDWVGAEPRLTGPESPACQPSIASSCPDRGRRSSQASDEELCHCPLSWVGEGSSTQGKSHKDSAGDARWGPQDKSQPLSFCGLSLHS